MRKSSFVWAIAAALLAAAPAPVIVAPAAAETAADVGAYLFEAEHFRKTAPDARIVYSYSRASKDAERTRPSFKDVVELQLEPGKSPATRNVVVTLFKGPMHRAAGPFDDVSFNPLAIMMLEYHLGDFSKILGGNARYFKNGIRAGMRDAAQSEPVKVKVAGRDVDALRFVVRPFENDPQKARFGAFAATTYTFTVSDEVPGSIYEIRITTPDPAGGEPILEEVTRYVDP
ncbi:hypothetical protein [Prosthecomicrobium sp. N25]|uniref:hypothetical protein n=1 Tax=Prosthecomicrobium sp. N25 TaxID=3129254 RepID=UPI0030787E40